MFDVVVWTAEVILALFFLVSGVPKVLALVTDRWSGFIKLPRGMTIMIGVCEVAASIGLVAPLLTDRAEWLTPMAGLGIAVIALMAGGFHIRQGEWVASVETALWAALAAGIVAARWDKFADGPSVTLHDVLPTVLIVLLAAVMVSLALLSRGTGKGQDVTPLDVAEPGDVMS